LKSHWICIDVGHAIVTPPPPYLVLKNHQTFELSDSQGIVMDKSSLSRTSSSVYFINVTSFGISGQLLRPTTTSPFLKRLFPSLYYFIIGAIASLFYKSPNVKVTYTSPQGEMKEQIIKKLYLGAIGNAKAFGGGMYVCPDADISDGEVIRKKKRKIHITIFC